MSKFCNGGSPCTLKMARHIAEATGSNVAVWINLQAALDAWFGPCPADAWGVDFDVGYSYADFKTGTASLVRLVRSGQ